MAYVINGKTIPHPNYTNGELWDERYPGAVECVGFAKWIYENYLYVGQGTGTRIADISWASQNGCEMIFEGFEPGCRLTIHPKVGNRSHTFIFCEATSTGILVYHANWMADKRGKNNVYLETIPWSDISDTYRSVSGYHAAN